MCGITGYVGDRSAVDTVLTNLKRLEYRGYDSAGVAFPGDDRIGVVRALGKIANLETALRGSAYPAHVAIAHTRWATHGRPSEANAHPHVDCTGTLAIVHNGIIENYAELRRELIAAGHRFHSETDTEVLAHLIEDEMNAEAPAASSLELAVLATLAASADADTPAGTATLVSRREPRTQDQVAAAMRRALRRVKGSYALAAVTQETPEAIYAARKDSPLVVGLGDGENFLASDIPAVMRYTRRAVLLEDGDFAIVEADRVTVTDASGDLVERAPIDVTWDDQAAEKGGYAHFMLKEIHEGPRTVADTLRGRMLDDGEVQLPNLAFTAADWQRFRRVCIVGCGTAYHAGVVGKRLMEQVLRRPVEVEVASEFRYGDPIVDAETLVVLISQSGETADTLAAMREARARGSATLAIVNVVGSTLARDADAVLLTQAGPEIGVASTKAYLAQLTALTLLTLYLARVGGTDNAVADELRHALRSLPEWIAECLRRNGEIAALATRLAGHRTFFYLGRGYDYAAALEAALKLKEISYLHAEAYPAGEMKHGPLALVEPGVAVIGLCTQAATAEKMVSNMKEVKAREGTVIAVIPDGQTVPDCADAVISVPPAPDALMPIVAMVPLQLLAYHIARERGCEIDQPRNLAKSVTVE
jgi:glucosamine--fructose-6-phosphate aminotransferase (isomerizing)